MRISLLTLLPLGKALSTTILSLFVRGGVSWMTGVFMFSRQLFHLLTWFCVIYIHAHLDQQCLDLVISSRFVLLPSVSYIRCLFHRLLLIWLTSRLIE